MRRGLEDPGFNKLIYSSLENATDPAYCPYSITFKG